jgi:ATP-dependent Lhr-like helicase
VYRALEDQGRVRRGYFVAERGATQFALPGAEERLRAKRPDDEEARTLILGATDPASPWGALVPWPREARGEGAEAGGRSPQRVPGARVIMRDGVLLAWLGRGGQSLLTFLPKEEPDASHAAAALARALVALARRRARLAMLATIDGGPPLESPFAKVLAEHGFSARQGALVFIPTKAPRPPFGREEERPPAKHVGARDARPEEALPRGDLLPLDDDFGLDDDLDGELEDLHA